MKRKNLGDSWSNEVLKIAADAFREGDIAKGEKILGQIPLDERLVARCVLRTPIEHNGPRGYKYRSQDTYYRAYDLIQKSVDGYVGINASEHSHPPSTIPWLANCAEVDESLGGPACSVSSRYVSDRPSSLREIQNNVDPELQMKRLQYQEIVPCLGKQPKKMQLKRKRK